MAVVTQMIAVTVSKCLCTGCCVNVTITRRHVGGIYSIIANENRVKMNVNRKILTPRLFADGVFQLVPHTTVCKRVQVYNVTTLQHGVPPTCRRLLYCRQNDLTATHPMYRYVTVLASRVNRRSELNVTQVTAYKVSFCTPVHSRCVHGQVYRAKAQLSTH